jgi:3-dehydroquinate dehydratase/shikimate dehydrogenase
MNAKYYFEMIYSPADTPQVQMARSKGMHVVLGSEMFVHQGARQFEIWTGKPAPVDEMHRVVLHAIQQAQTAAPAAAKSRNGKSSARSTSR